MRTITRLSDIGSRYTVQFADVGLRPTRSAGASDDVALVHDWPREAKAEDVWGGLRAITVVVGSWLVGAIVATAAMWLLVGG